MALDGAAAAHDGAARDLDERTDERAVSDLAAEQVDEVWCEDPDVASKLHVGVDHDGSPACRGADMKSDTAAPTARTTVSVISGYIGSAMTLRHTLSVASSGGVAPRYPFCRVIGIT